MTPAAPAAEEEAAPAHCLVDAQGTTMDGAGRADIEARLQAGQFFWLDLAKVGDEEASWLRDVFHFHPLAVEDAIEFGQRPKIEEYDDFTFLVLYGSASGAGLGVFADPGTVGPSLGPGGDGVDPSRMGDVAEVHFFVTERCLVTVHETGSSTFKALHRRLRERARPVVKNPTRLLYLVADTLVDSYFPVLNGLDDRIDDLEDQVIDDPHTSQLAELLDLKRGLICLRRVVAPQRDMFASLAAGVVELPGLDDDARRYLRDVYDHLIRLTDQLDSYRDLLAGTTDAYLSVTSNQLNVVMKQLAIISTIFLPLSFLTGFFGQNFSWLVDRIGSWEAFIGVGLGTELMAVVALLALFKRRRWV